MIFFRRRPVKSLASLGAIRSLVKFRDYAYSSLCFYSLQFRFFLSDNSGTSLRSVTNTQVLRQIIRPKPTSLRLLLFELHVVRIPRFARSEKVREIDYS